MRVHSKSQIRLARPVLQIMKGLMAFAREVGNLVLWHSRRVELLARHFIEIRSDFVVRNEMSVVSRTACNQLAAKPGILVNLEHVNTGMGNAGGNRFIN